MGGSNLFGQDTVPIRAVTKARPLELCLNLGDGCGLGQAAAFSWPASTPSVNVTPVITFGN